MPKILYTVKLSNEERNELSHLASNTKGAPQKIKNALILLAVDRGEFQTSINTDERIAEILDIDRGRIYRVKRDCVEGSIELALTGKTENRAHRARAFDGEQEARLVALACTTPPEGHASWTVRLLADKVVELKILEKVSYSTVSRVLKKNEIKPWLKKEWVIPAEQSGAFVAAMENVLDVYEKPYDSNNPVICIDEMPKQLIEEQRNGFVGSDGVQYFDSEYIRNGTTNVFMAVEPLAGRRIAEVIDSKKRTDFANFVAKIANNFYPAAETITVVCDNLSTHDAGSFYEAFSPEVAHALMRRICFVHTPKHGSWLDMAEIELSVLSRQNLSRRIGTVEEMKKELDAWLSERNKNCVKIDWQFTASDARTRLKRLYPVYC